MLANKIDHKLNATKLRCPQPIILTKQKISQLNCGETLLVSVTDPSFEIDCKVYSGQSGNQLLQSWQEEEVSYYLLIKST